MSQITPEIHQLMPLTLPVVNITPGAIPVEGGTTGTFTITLDSPAGEGGLVVNYTIAGTATLTQDYSVIAGNNIATVTKSSFTIAAGQTSATLTIRAAADFVSDLNETIDLSLAIGAGYQLFQGHISAFIPKVDYATGANPRSISVADFNNDGKADLAVANLASNTVSVFLRNPTNTGFDAKIDYAAGASPRLVSVGDFNSDGKVDLVVTNSDSNTVSLLLRNASNTGFENITTCTTGFNPQSVGVADFNGDGKLDLAVANLDSDTVSILLRNASNTGFDAKVDYATGSQPCMVNSGDFNNDGKADLAVANLASNTVSVFLRNSANTGFDAKVDYMTAEGPNFVSAGDFNNDGKLDLVTASASSNKVSLLFRNAANTGFDTKDIDTAGTGSHSITVGDFNNDGKLDIAIANFIDNTVTVLLRNANNTDFDEISYATGAWPLSVNSGDFNNDGNLDLAVANYWDNTISVLLNNPSPTATLAIIDTPSTNISPTLVTTGAMTDFTEQTPTAIDKTIAINDGDGDADWNGGTLQIQITTNNTSNDNLILPAVNNGGIWLNSTNKVLMSNTTAIGSANASSVNNGNPWILTFNAAATNALVQSTAQTIQFYNDSDTPSLGARTVTFTITDKKAGTNSAMQTVSVAAVNDAPTLTAFSSTVAGGNENSEITITLADLQKGGNEADVDGSVTAFVIKSVSNGSLKIGTSASMATAWNATTNNTINSTRKAYWTPDANANGTLNAFTVVAEDNGGIDSATPIPVTIAVNAVNYAPTFITPASINYTDTIFDDTFTSATGSLTANDLDGNALIYGISDGTDNGNGTGSKNGLYGVLTVFKATGAYSFEANDYAIESNKDSSNLYTQTKAIGALAFIVLPPSVS